MTITRWSLTPARSSIRRITAPASPSSAFSAPSAQSSAQQWWVALANLRMVFNSATNAVAAAALTQGPPDAAQRDPRSLMIWSRIRIADL